MKALPADYRLTQIKNQPQLGEHRVGWVSAAIPITYILCKMMGIAALNPSYETEQ